jgi:hypothetical protein
MIPLSEIKSYLKITGTDSDTVLIGMINRAISRIESYCNRKFNEEVTTTTPAIPSNFVILEQNEYWMKVLINGVTEKYITLSDI